MFEMIAEINLSQSRYFFGELFMVEMHLICESDGYSNRILLQ
jgi:hypothetical protein